MYVAPSLLAANFLNLEKEIKAIQEAGADLLHIDVMDGYFVPNFTFGPCVIEKISTISNLPLDIHLMVEDVKKFTDLFIPLKPKFISFHVEIEKHPIRMCEYIRSFGIHPAIVLNPHTPIDSIKHIIDFVDMILLMSVNPGFGGQSFLNFTYEKIKALREIIDRKNAKVFIEVDGGVNGLNASELEQAGADILVAGSYIFSSNDYKTSISSLKLEF
ncbi:ribulose-phosphate 3-epimerase [Campylobacter sp. LH-2024]|uniref:ribulose-phosphate 3-epimerase n=1 Tax=Campylobacter TaxID=194 RepID=UPI001DA5E5B6|nr:ribulose-phosphate 3-epimerase [Campylobacter sp. RM10537]MBZ7929391.1 ribulose-phosphate 3-epimerase [Campylobacter sp. W0067]MBZ7931580.1 ribulose-phosphate 3-epimerase [Campylobacter sp. RM12910]MBZ7933971.1 ribulose-phosphate 3-epimerase [Campylobacter sp. W0065]MBZ7937191.1 ribulose-phosphate 3-epimerase [Campylobacter sp. RM10538]MBZ7940659.1 ribulose-phosphate 3-epimerase [Campylobacter sp. W0047]MBZ7941754.1 ribulose-phosphate 3-epimerase [Campylobacter sp. W0045]MBZ7944656.1 ribu